MSKFNKAFNIMFVAYMKCGINDFPSTIKWCIYHNNKLQYLFSHKDTYKYTFRTAGDLLIAVRGVKKSSFATLLLAQHDTFQKCSDIYY